MSSGHTNDNGSVGGISCQMAKVYDDAKAARQPCGDGRLQHCAICAVVSPCESATHSTQSHTSRHNPKWLNLHAPSSCPYCDILGYPGPHNHTGHNHDFSKRHTVNTSTSNSPGGHHVAPVSHSGPRSAKYCKRCAASTNPSTNKNKHNHNTWDCSCLGIDKITWDDRTGPKHCVLCERARYYDTNSHYTQDHDFGRRYIANGCKQPYTSSSSSRPSNGASQRSHIDFEPCRRCAYAERNGMICRTSPHDTRDCTFLIPGISSDKYHQPCCEYCVRSGNMKSSRTHCAAAHDFGKCFIAGIPPRPQERNECPCCEKPQCKYEMWEGYDTY